MIFAIFYLHTAQGLHIRHYGDQIKWQMLRKWQASINAVFAQVRYCLGNG